MSGSMNGALQEQDGIDENIMYDLAEGHHAKLKGSMNGPASNGLDYSHHLLSLRQGNPDRSTGGNISQEATEVGQQQQLDTNVMYDPVSGEGLVCVNGRCISNKRKFQVHDEDEVGLKSGRRRRNRGRGRGRGRARGGNRMQPGGRQ
mmetsp:Transcript_36409/g.44498  ORF Transcript_36409/g.44498 Transcript_36409/m.44498 type:complete len:147 (+) Transcript_36409:583-1023(+)